MLGASISNVRAGREPRGASQRRKDYGFRAAQQRGFAFVARPPKSANQRTNRVSRWSSSAADYRAGVDNCGDCDGCAVGAVEVAGVWLGSRVVGDGAFRGARDVAG